MRHLFATPLVYLSRALIVVGLASLAACAGGGITAVRVPDVASSATANSPSSSATQVTAAIDSNVIFADWGIEGGFTAMPLTALLAEHPQLAQDQQLFVTAGAQADPAIPPQLLVALCLQESSGGLDAGSYGGPFQFTDDGAWATYGPKNGDRNSMADAAIGAANYIAALLTTSNNDLNAALRSYNGPVSQGGNPQYQSQIQQWMQGSFVYGPGV